MPFFPLDWLGDTRSLTTRQKGIWIDLLCYMWGSEKRGKLTGTWDSIARMVGEPWLECETEIREISRKNVLEISEDGVTVTLLCRRMVYDEKKRESIRLRVTEYRKKDSNAYVTRMKQGEVRSQKLEVIKDKDVPPNPLKGVVIPEDLLESESEIRDWVEYKSQKKQSYKQKGLDALWRVFRAIPKEGRRASVDHSMSNNWSGLFEKNLSAGKSKQEVPHWSETQIPLKK